MHSKTSLIIAATFAALAAVTMGKANRLTGGRINPRETSASGLVAH